MGYFKNKNKSAAVSDSSSSSSSQRDSIDLKLSEAPVKAISVKQAERSFEHEEGSVTSAYNDYGVDLNGEDADTKIMVIGKLETKTRVTQADLEKIVRYVSPRLNLNKTSEASAGSEISPASSSSSSSAQDDTSTALHESIPGLHRDEVVEAHWPSPLFHAACGIMFVNVTFETGCDMSALSILICEDWHFRHLSFVDHCSLSDAGIEPVLDSLLAGMKGSTKLLEFNVRNCGLKDSATKTVLYIIHRSPYLRFCSLAGNRELRSMMGHNVARYEEKRARVDRPMIFDLRATPADIQRVRSYAGKQELMDWLRVKGNIARHWSAKGRGLGSDFCPAEFTLNRRTCVGTITFPDRSTLELPPGTCHRICAFRIIGAGEDRPLLVVGPRTVFALDGKRFPYDMAQWQLSVETNRFLAELSEEDRASYLMLMSKPTPMSKQELYTKIEPLIDATFGKGSYILALEKTTTATGALTTPVCQSAKPNGKPNSMSTSATDPHYTIFVVLIKDLPFQPATDGHPMPSSSLAEALSRCTLGDEPATPSTTTSQQERTAAEQSAQISAPSALDSTGKAIEILHSRPSSQPAGAAAAAKVQNGSPEPETGDKRPFPFGEDSDDSRKKQERSGF